MSSLQKEETMRPSKKSSQENPIKVSGCRTNALFHYTAKAKINRSEKMVTNASKLKLPSARRANP